MFGAVRIAQGAPAGEWLDVGARKPRSVVAALALHAGKPVTADLLADLVWAGEPPRAAHGALHAYISGLRKVLDPERTSRSAASRAATSVSIATAMPLNASATCSRSDTAWISTRSA